MNERSAGTRRLVWLFLTLLVLAALPSMGAAHPARAEIDDESDATEPFTFAVAADMRQYAGSGSYNTSQYFRGACEAIAASGSTAFMVIPGDLDPPADVRWTIDQTLGADYLWFPAVGNHEAETASDMTYLRNYNLDPNGAAEPNIVNTGPTNGEETTYSFDYANAHFVVINEYYDGTSDVGTDGDVTDALYNWLVDDLASTTQEHIFIIGHEPAYPLPDADNGRLRHQYDSLNAHSTRRDRFWTLSSDAGVLAYLTGHTHNYSIARFDGVWQLDVGHARGLGDTGARSTFVLIRVDGNLVTYETFRDDANGGDYTLMHQGTLTPLPYAIYLPVIMRSDIIN